MIFRFRGNISRLRSMVFGLGLMISWLGLMIRWFRFMISWFRFMISWLGFMVLRSLVGRLGCDVKLLRCVVIMSVMSILVVFLGIASMHRQTKDHFHTEGMTSKLALGIANLLLRGSTIF